MNPVCSNAGNILNLRFSQDHNLISCAMDTGIRIYNVEPLSEKMHLGIPTVGSIVMCETLYRSNLIAMVGGGQKQKFAENSVLIWDDLAEKFVLEFVFLSPVLSVKMRKDRLYVALQSQVHVFSYPNNPAKLSTFETGINPKGICEVSPFSTSERQLLVYPGKKTGAINIVDLATTEGIESSSPLMISAHQSDIAYVTLNHQGTLVATASVIGTLIRVFDTDKKDKVAEFRRGADNATVYCINFSHDSEYLCVSSDKGTIHIFALKNKHLNRRSTFSNIGIHGPYLDSQWALARFRVDTDCACICAFGSQSSIHAVCVNGTFHKFVFTKDGNCNREAFDIFLNICEDDEF